MSRKRTIKTITLNQATGALENLIGEVEKPPIAITSASIKDDFCHYSYDITTGIGIGDSHSVKGSGIIKDDLKNAFAAFNIHLAVVDDVFNNAGLGELTYQEMKSHEFTFLYQVTGFKIKGSDADPSIILTGNKYVKGVRGRIDLETPKIPMDNLGGYKWYNELKEAADTARKEVRLYKEGKYTPVETEDDDDKENPAQSKMDFSPVVSERTAEETEADNEAFENARV